MASRSGRVVNLMGSTDLILNGSMMVFIMCCAKSGCLKSSQGAKCIGHMLLKLIIVIWFVRIPAHCFSAISSAPYG